MSNHVRCSLTIMAYTGYNNIIKHTPRTVTSRSGVCVRHGNGENRRSLAIVGDVLKHGSSTPMASASNPSACFLNKSRVSEYMVAESA